MIEKTNLKNKAIKLRKEGKTYSEILKKIPVARSTLSLWLREIGLSRPQKQRITRKRIKASLKGAKKRKKQRIEFTREIYKKSAKEIGKISDRELWLIGIILYWTEGTKEKYYRGCSGVDFVNSDPFLVTIFLKWLINICNVKKNDIILRLFIHENNKYRIEEVKKYWLTVTGFKKIDYIYLKKHNIKTNRKKITNDVYYGGIGIRVRRSSSLIRRIAGWSKGIGKNYCRIV